MVDFVCYVYIYIGVVVKLKKIRNITAQMLEQVAYRSPQHVSMIDCHGHLQATDIINFFRKAGQHIKVMTELVITELLEKSFILSSPFFIFFKYIFQSLTVELTELGPHTNDVLLLSAAKYCVNLRSISVDWLSISEKVIQSCNRLTKSNNSPYWKLLLRFILLHT